MKRVLSVLAALVLLFSFSTPAAATHPYSSYNGDYYYNSAIDTNGNARFDIMVCFGAVGDNIYANRDAIITFLRNEWGRAQAGENGYINGTNYVNGFGSSGACGTNDPAELWIKWSNAQGNCGLNIPHGWVYLSGGGHGKQTIWMNNYCTWDFSPPISDNYASFPAIVAHEAGHAFGLDHTSPQHHNNTLMDDGGPDNCNYHDGFSAGLSQDDASQFRTRYSGINDDGSMFPNYSPCYS